MRQIAKVEYAGQYSVSWTESDGIHTVTYGKQVGKFSRYINAHGNFMACQRHAASCAGLYDTVEPETIEIAPYFEVVNQGAFND